MGENGIGGMIALPFAKPGKGMQAKVFAKIQNAGLDSLQRHGVMVGAEGGERVPVVFAFKDKFVRPDPPH